MIAPDLQGTRVCAVVVTYNRKELLRKCLHALLSQTHAVSKILVINNASTDDTLQLLEAEFPSQSFAQIAVHTLPANVGGAGGFHEGMKRASVEGCDWLWLLDDDTITRPETLAELLAAHSRFPPDRRPDIVASKVVWTDGSLHYMNSPWRRLDDPEGAFDAAACATMPLRAATFVSVLIHRSCVEEFGLPLADYFIWGDDVEYTARILRKRRGVAVPASVAVHETAINHTAMNAAPPKFYYFVRNELWLTFRSSALTQKERLKRIVATVTHTARYLAARNFELPALKFVGLATWHAITLRPLK
jgi:GT2 family glycosyltransferase